jgi:hypothetical protein
MSSNYVRRNSSVDSVEESHLLKLAYSRNPTRPTEPEHVEIRRKIKELENDAHRACKREHDEAEGKCSLINRILKKNITDLKSMGTAKGKSRKNKKRKNMKHRKSRKNNKY